MNTTCMRYSIPIGRAITMFVYKKKTQLFVTSFHRICRYFRISRKTFINLQTCLSGRRSFDVFFYAIANERKHFEPVEKVEKIIPNDSRLSRGQSNEVRRIGDRRSVQLA